jgi:predicted HicB family RNase H-like nuclease
MGKLPSLGVRIAPDIKAALERAAEEDKRSLSSLVQKILTEWVDARDASIKPSKRKPK